MAKQEKEASLTLIAAQDLQYPRTAGPRLCMRHQRLQGRRGAVWHQGEDRSGPRAQTAPGRLSGRSQRRG